MKLFFFSEFSGAILEFSRIVCNLKFSLSLSRVS